MTSIICQLDVWSPLLDQSGPWPHPTSCHGLSWKFSTIFCGLHVLVLSEQNAAHACVSGVHVWPDLERKYLISLIHFSLHGHQFLNLWIMSLVLWAKKERLSYVWALFENSTLTYKKYQFESDCQSRLAMNLRQSLICFQEWYPQYFRKRKSEVLASLCKSQSAEITIVDHTFSWLMNSTNQIEDHTCNEWWKRDFFN